MSENRLIKECRELMGCARFDNLDDFDKVAKLLGVYELPLKCKLPSFPRYSFEDLTDALAEFMPDKREFWLRVGATQAENFRTAVAKMFSEADDDE